MENAHSGAILASRHWVFDLDGTLTVAVHDFDAIRKALGVPHGGDILAYLSSLPEEEARLARGKLNDIEMELAGRSRAAVGARTLVGLLHAQGAQLGILTRNTRENALVSLGRIGLAQYFPPSHVLGRDEAPAKPDPDGIHQLARRWGVAAHQVVMVGDYRFDLETGRAAGAGTVHVDPSRLFAWPELADLAVASLAELATAVAFLQGGEALQLVVGDLDDLVVDGEHDVEAAPLLDHAGDQVGGVDQGPR